MLFRSLDKTHLERHFQPFLKDFGIDRGKALIEVHSGHQVSICSDGWGEGHRAAPGSFVYPLLHQLTQADGWEKLPEFVPELHAQTTNPIRQVSLTFDQNGFHVRVSLADTHAGGTLTVGLLREGVEIETLQIRDGEPGQFTSQATAGEYCAQARVERPPRSWKERASALLRKKRMYDEMKSRIVLVKAP